MENKEIAVVQEERKWTPEEVNTIKNTVAYGANDNELKMLLSIAGTYGLDPFLHEIWFVNMKGRNTIITGRDGYLKIANRNPNFDGMTSDVVRAEDKFVKQGDNIQHLYGGSNRGPIIGAYAVVYRKDRRHPAYVFAPFAEYNAGNNVWRQYPSAMILKVAESMALKRAFSISGLVTEEEISTPQPQQPQPQPQVSKQQQAQSTERKTQLRQLWERYLAVCGNQKDHAKNAMLKVTGKENSADFTDEDIKALFDDVIRREDEKMNTEIQAPSTIDVDEVSIEDNTTKEENHNGD